MARYKDATCRLCRREGVKLFLKGDRCVSKKCALERKPFEPGIHGPNKRRKKESEYGKQLREKQKVKRAYGILEKSMKRYYVSAGKMQGIVGENMLALLERRIDNVVYRLGLASSRVQARQMVNHGLICLNGKKANIPSIQVNAGDIITIKEGKEDLDIIKEIKGMNLRTPKWLEIDTNKLAGKVLDLPTREDIDMNIKEHLIVELYSR